LILDEKRRKSAGIKTYEDWKIALPEFAHLKPTTNLS
jgi:hypothetical protein